MKPHFPLPARWLPLLALAWPGLAAAFTVNIDSGSRAIYLRVGDGGFSSDPYRNGGEPLPGTTGARNLVEGTVDATALGNGTPQALTGTSRVTSDWDRFAFCNSGQTYVGGFFRGNRNAGTATLTADVTAPLSNGSESIPFSKISWIASGNSDGNNAQPIPSNSFGDTSKVLASFPVNTWRESCHSFRYANDAVVAAGSYQGTITYTLAAP